MAYTIEKSEKGYLLFTITRGDKRNAVDYDVMEGLSKVIHHAADPDVLALVITGEGEDAFVLVETFLFFTCLKPKKKPIRCFQKCPKFFILC